MIGTKLHTLTEFETLLAQPEHHDRLYELIEGIIVEKMPTEKHGFIAGFIVTELNLYLRQHPIGRAGVEIRYQVPDDLYNSRLPDVVFRAGNHPATEQGAVIGMPDLTVEIQSPHESLKTLRQKAHYYLAHGTRLVWLIVTDKRLVEVYTPADELILTDDDTLTGGDVLPNFTLPIKNIFNS